MATELGIATPWIFTAFSAGLLLSAFLGPASGRLIDVHGGRRVLPVSNLLIAAGLVLLGFSSGMVSLFAAWLVMGLGMSCGLYEAAFSTLAGIYGRDARRAITGITLIAGFASTVCWPLSAYMDVTIGWRATCFAWAAAHLIFALPINLLLPPRGQGRAPAARAAGSRGDAGGRRRGVGARGACTGRGARARVLAVAPCSPDRLGAHRVARASSGCDRADRSGRAGGDAVRGGPRCGQRRHDHRYRYAAARPVRTSARRARRQTKQ